MLTQNNFFQLFQLLTVLGILFSTNSFAQEQTIPTAFSLQEAKAFAIENSYSSKSAVLDERKAKQRVKEITAIGLPQVSAKGSFQNFQIIPTQVVPNFLNDFLPAPDPNAPEFVEAQFGTDFNIAGGVTVSQLIFDGSYIVGLQAAKTYVEIAKNDRIKTDIEIKNDVTKAYGNVLVARENVKILQQNIENVNKILQETKLLLSNGFVESTDVDQLQLTLSGLNNNLKNAKGQQSIAEKLLKFSIGIPVDAPMELKDELNVLLNANNDASFLEKDFDPNNHIDYRQVLVNVQSQSLLLRNEKAAYLPSLGAFYNYQQNYLANDLSMGSNQWFPASVLGVELNIPIFSSFMRKNKVAQASVELEKAEIMREQLSEQLKLGAESAKVNYRNALDNFNTEKQNVELAKRIKDNTFLKYKEGVASSFDLNNAQSQELEAQRRYISSMFEIIQNKTALDTALGNYN